MRDKIPSKLLTDRTFPRLYVIAGKRSVRHQLYRHQLYRPNLAVHFDKRTILYRKVLDKEPTLTVHP
jgi:hypothetical protein